MEQKKSSNWSLFKPLCITLLLSFLLFQGLIGVGKYASPAIIQDNIYALKSLIAAIVVLNFLMITLTVGNFLDKKYPINFKNNGIVIIKNDLRFSLILSFIIGVGVYMTLVGKTEMAVFIAYLSPLFFVGYLLNLLRNHFSKSPAI